MLYLISYKCEGNEFVEARSRDEAIEKFYEGFDAPEGAEVEVTEIEEAYKEDED